MDLGGVICHCFFRHFLFLVLCFFWIMLGLVPWSCSFSFHSVSFCPIFKFSGHFLCLLTPVGERCSEVVFQLLCSPVTLCQLCLLCRCVRPSLWLSETTFSSLLICPIAFLVNITFRKESFSQVTLSFLLMSIIH